MNNRQASSTKEGEAADSHIAMAQHATVDNNEDSSEVVKGIIDDTVDEPTNKPWYHFKGDTIAQGFNLVGQTIVAEVRFGRRRIHRRLFLLWFLFVECHRARCCCHVQYFPFRILCVSGTRRSRLH